MRLKDFVIIIGGLLMGLWIGSLMMSKHIARLEERVTKLEAK